MNRNGWVDAQHMAAVISKWCIRRSSRIQTDSLSSLILQLRLEHRVQFDGPFCRASYGHSTRFYKPTTVAEPNQPLYHGTSTANLPSIELFGLWPMRRRFVQLTTDFEYAHKVAARSPDPIVLQILREQAMADGIQFISTGSHAWLAEPIPAHLLMGWLAGVWDLGSKQPIFRETDLKENRR